MVCKLFEVTEHRARLYLHRPTGYVVVAALPEEVVRGGLVGPRLSALVARAQRTPSTQRTGGSQLDSTSAKTAVRSIYSTRSG